MNPNMRISTDHGLGLFTRITVERDRGNRRGKGPKIHQDDYPSISPGYTCYVCGSTFETNQQWVTHLEKFKHIDLYSTVSPQESEEIRRVSLGCHTETKIS